MIEVQADLWTFEPADARVITTNGYVKNNGQAVMGRRLRPGSHQDL